MKYKAIFIFIFGLIGFLSSAITVNAATNIYYSVGQNTSDHKTSNPQITISNGIGTFSIAQTATNMGVGDKVTYNTSSVAYISGKISTSAWSLITATGGVPADISNSNVVSITHTFSSLGTAISQSSQAGYLNTSNLVTGNYILNIPLYYDSGPETSSITIQGYTTGANNYLNIYTPYNTTTQVNQSQRPSGIWDTGKYRIIPSSNPFQASIEVNQAYTKIDGIQVSPWNASNRNGINITADFVTISNSIVKGGGSDNAGIRFDTGVNTAGYIYNTIIYDLGLYGIYEALAAGPYFYVYNVTIHNCPSSIVSYGSSMVAKNVLSYSSTQGFVGTYSATSTNNASNLASNSQGSNPRDSVTVSFIDEANDNFHISSSDSGVLNRGASLSSDPYFPITNDIDLETRNGVWDIGADEYIDSTPPSAPTSLLANVISSSEIDISWASSTDDVSVSGYVVYRDSSPIATSTMKTYSNTGLTQNTTYVFSVKAYDSSNNYSSQSSTLSTSTLADITAPTRSGGAPSGTLDPQTTSTTISLTTDENATCRYSTSASTAYDDMTASFNETLSTSHTATVSSLTDGSSNSYYVRCVDAYGNKNATSYTISFSIGIAATANNDYYSWSLRLDRNGKSAGTMTSTPWPIDENSTSYTVYNDENTNGKTFYLGSKYYVDGGYQGSSNDGTFDKPYTTISSALQNVSSGNVTIVVRGAHDSFDGVYTESNGFNMKTGTDDTHRFMIVGYKQERPTIDGSNSTQNIIRTTSQTNSYATIQRLKIQNSKALGIRLGNTLVKYDGYFNLIDTEVYNTANDTKNYSADGNIYFLNVDNVWVFHVTSHHTMGHCIKIGDNADYAILEWSIAYECGYWSTMVSEKSITDWSISPATHPSGLDLPNDSGQNGINYKVRYNIAYDTLFYGVQLRNASNFSFHHNEIYNTPRFDDVTGATTGVTGSPQVLLYGNGQPNVMSGSAYSNIIYNSGDSSSSGITISGLNDNNTVNIYNNIIYNNPLGELYIYGYLESPGSSRTFNIYNNTFSHTSNTTATIHAPSNIVAGEVHIKNNILSQSGTYQVLELDNDVTDFDYNLYYYPSGSLGKTANSHDYNSGASTNPLFSSALSSTYTWGKGNITSSSPAKNIGKNLATEFLVDLDRTARPQGSAWDIGAYEYSASDTNAPIITSFSIPIESSSLTIAINSFTAQDNNAVFKYLINESSNTPSASDVSWSNSAPSSYTFSSAGQKILYGWAMDSNQNISSSISQSTTISVTQSNNSSSNQNNTQTTFSSSGGGQSYGLLQNSKPSISTTTVLIKKTFGFKNELFLGKTHNDVKLLQILLNQDKDTIVSVYGPGSPNHETNYFGAKTQEAVKKFQKKYAKEILKPANIKNPTGYVGSFTLNILNKISNR